MLDTGRSRLIICVVSVALMMAFRLLLQLGPSWVYVFLFWGMIAFWGWRYGRDYGLVAATVGLVFTWSEMAYRGMLPRATLAAVIYTALTYAIALVFGKINSLNEKNRRNIILRNAQLEVSLDPIVTIDSEGRIIEFNPAAEREFGYKKSDILGQQMGELIIPYNLRSKHQEAFERFKKTRESHILGRRIEMSALRKDGTEFAAELAINHVVFGGESIFVADIRNISGQKAYEAQLIESEARYRSALQNSPAAIWCYEAVGGIDVSLSKPEQINLMAETGILTEANDAVAKMYGFESSGEIVGAKVTEFMDVTQPQNIRMLEALIDSSYKLTNFETVEKHKDGHDMIMLNSMIGEVVDGKLLRVRGSQIDITERRKYVLERERLLEREREARKEAQVANQVKDEFIATVSHELRSPLAVITNGITVLQLKGGLPEESKKTVGMIERNAGALKHIVDDLLDLSRLSAGKLILDTTEVDPVEVVTNVIESLRPGFEAKSIDCTFQYERNRDNSVKADRTRLQQIVWNLLTNATKFTPKGGLIEVTVKRSGSNVQIVVKDNGQGISPQFMPYIFDKFRQEDGSNTRAQGGLGLGLSLSKTLVEMHGGTVIAESPGEDGGSTFTVTLPLVEVHANQYVEHVVTNGKSRINSTVKEQDSDVKLDGLSVLVVEDDENSAVLIKTLIEHRGAKVDVANNVAQALLHLSLDSYHIMVSDIQMPVEDGYSLIRRLRESDGHNKNIPAVALTAHARKEDRKRALEAGYQEHMTKPVSPPDLFSTIKRLASNS